MNSKPIIEVKKSATENNMTLVRRFSRRVQEAGIIQSVKGNRYNERAPSKLDRKLGALKKLKRGKESRNSKNSVNGRNLHTKVTNKRQCQWIQTSQC